MKDQGLTRAAIRACLAGRYASPSAEQTTFASVKGALWLGTSGVEAVKNQRQFARIADCQMAKTMPQCLNAANACVHKRFSRQPTQVLLGFNVTKNETENPCIMVSAMVDLANSVLEV